jgi:hypothetical protein
MRSAFVVAIGLLSVLACSQADDSSKKPDLTVTIAGEGAATTGFSFPAASDNEPSVVDGWDIRFERILVTVDHIVLTDNPDMSPSDQSLTGGPVASARGPWAVDMTKPGKATEIRLDGYPTPQDLELGRSPTAQPLVRLQGLDDAQAFDPSLRYGFNFDFVAATEAAKKTNLDSAAAADYAEMVAKGWSVLYVGTATFKGQDCKSSDPTYDFDALPRVVRFRFGFATPTQYINCQNTDLRGRAFDGEEAQRGVQVKTSGSTVAQITLHVDHPFWNTVDHDAAELFFDQIAVAASPDGNVTLDDLAKLDFTAFKDAAGRDLPWRSCVASKPPRQGTRAFDSGSVAVDPAASPDTALRNYHDYVSYQQSTEGHLNADGLCAVKRLFASPR